MAVRTALTRFQLLFAEKKVKIALDPQKAEPFIRDGQRDQRVCVSSPQANATWVL